MDISNLTFEEKLTRLRARQESLLTRPNPQATDFYNGIYQRFEHPVVTRDHIPLEWRYDLDPATNPLLIERLGVNCVFNAGAIERDGKILLVTRVEGNDRKSFFAIAESDNGIDGFRFWQEPVDLAETASPDTNVYDMRLVEHEDGWIYGLFCTERKDPAAPPHDTSSAIAQCGLVRTRDLLNWQRLPDLQSQSPQQRNVVLHPEFINGKYALYTRPQEGFIDAGSGGGIGWALCASMENAVINEEKVLDERVYHTIKEAKNGAGPAPLKTVHGWLHLAHGVRHTGAGLRYVLYLFMTALDDPSRITHRPGGHFLAPLGAERTGDVANVVFSNGWLRRANDEVFLYYASSDTRLHVAVSTIDQLVDYVRHTPEDPLTTRGSLQQRQTLIRNNHHTRQ